jgi:hypothetical protein
MKKLLLILSLIFSSPAFAEKVDERFAVKNVIVNEVAQTSDRARKNAVKNAQKRAFTEVVRRFVEFNDDDKLIPEKISSMVQAMEFHDEVITDRRYKALVDVYFYPEQTEFFINNEILSNEKKKISILVIPVFNENGLAKLWQKGNRWLGVWGGAGANDFVDIKVPMGDINDINNLKLADLPRLSEVEISNLENAYAVDKIVVADLYYNYKILEEEAEYKVFLKELGDFENTTLVARADGLKDEDHEKHLQYLLKKSIENLLSGWASFNNESENSKIQQFIIRVQNINDWIKIKENLDDVNVIKTYKVDSFAARYAKVKVEFVDKPIEVLETMKDLGFRIYREDDYVILQTK